MRSLKQTLHLILGLSCLNFRNSRRDTSSKESRAGFVHTTTLLHTHTSTFFAHVEEGCVTQDQEARHSVLQPAYQGDTIAPQECHCFEDQEFLH